MKTIKTLNHKLDVLNICFETVCAISGHAKCVGFDSILIDGLLSFDSLDELQEAMPPVMYNEVMTALDIAAQEERDEWHTEKLTDLRAYLAR